MEVGKATFFSGTIFPSPLWASVLGPWGSMLRFLCSFAPGPPSLLLLSAKFKLCWGVEISGMFSKVLFSTHAEQLLSPLGLEDCLELLLFFLSLLSDVTSLPCGYEHSLTALSAS